MHIPGHMVSDPVAVTTNAVALAVLVPVSAAVLKDKNIDAGRFAAVTSLIFAAQMLNFPVFDGTSGHLVGGVLASSVLGIPQAILSLTTVLTVQAFVFGDGGVSALGANVINMALIGAGLGGFLSAYLQRRGVSRGLSLLTASWMSVVLASLSCSVEVAISGVVPASKIIPSMVGVHALIGLGEAGITLALAGLLSRMRTSTSVVICAGVMAVVSPWASAWPDGFESVLEKLNVTAWASGASSMGAFPDYTVPAISHNVISTAVAGLVGVMITYGLSRCVLFLSGKETNV